MLKYLAISFIPMLIMTACNQSNDAKQASKQTDTNTPLEIKFKVIQLGAMPHGNVKAVVNLLKERFPASILSQENKELPPSASTKVKSFRYRADSLIRYFKPNDLNTYVVLLTAKDISTTKIKEPKERYQDWGVMGLGYRPGNACIISTYRLKHPNRVTTMARFRKVVIHEIGHCFGLAHCSTPQCVMNDANESIKTIDAAGEEYCEDCAAELE